MIIHRVSKLLLEIHKGILKDCFFVDIFFEKGHSMGLGHRVSDGF